MTTRLQSLPGDQLAIDRVALLPGCFISESRKRLPCEGCGTIFENNREFFVDYRRVLRRTPKSGRYCLDCARDLLGDRCTVESGDNEKREKEQTMSSTTIEQTITQAQEVMASLPEFAAQNAYVYYNQATRRHGFFFATDDQAAERYARTSGRAEQTNWLIVAVVPHQ